MMCPPAHLQNSGLSMRLGGRQHGRCSQERQEREQALTSRITQFLCGTAGPVSQLLLRHHGLIRLAHICGNESYGVQSLHGRKTTLFPLCLFPSINSAVYVAVERAWKSDQKFGIAERVEQHVGLNLTLSLGGSR